MSGQAAAGHSGRWMAVLSDRCIKPDGSCANINCWASILQRQRKWENQRAIKLTGSFHLPLFSAPVWSISIAQANILITTSIMGTRHLIVVVYQGKWHIAQYGQYDGYPEGVGMRLVRLLAPSTGLVDQIRAGLAHTYMLPAGDPLFAAAAAAKQTHIDSFVPYIDDGRIAQSAFQRWCDDPVARYSDDLLAVLPSLQPTTSSAVLVLVAHASAENRLPMDDSSEFANDALFCEWTYVVDFDEEVFEVYTGGTAKTPGHRFEHIGAENATVPGYITSVPFARLDAYNEDSAGFVKMIDDELAAIRTRNADTAIEIID